MVACAVVADGVAGVAVEVAVVRVVVVEVVVASAVVVVMIEVVSVSVAVAVLKVVSVGRVASVMMGVILSVLLPVDKSVAVVVTSMLCLFWANLKNRRMAGGSCLLAVILSTCLVSRSRLPKRSRLRIGLGICCLRNSRRLAAWTSLVSRPTIVKASSLRWSTSGSSG